MRLHGFGHRSPNLPKCPHRGPRERATVTAVCRHLHGDLFFSQQKLVSRRQSGIMFRCVAEASFRAVSLRAANGHRVFCGGTLRLAIAGWVRRYSDGSGAIRPEGSRSMVTRGVASSVALGELSVRPSRTPRRPSHASRVNHASPFFQTGVFVRRPSHSRPGRKHKVAKREHPVMASGRRRRPQP